MSRFIKYFVSFLLLLGLLFFFALPPFVDRVLNRVPDGPNVLVSEKVGDLYQSLWIADLHADALLWQRNLLKRNKHGHVDIPRLIDGNVALQAFTIVSQTPFGLNFESNSDKSDMITFLVAAQRWPLRTWFNLTERALYQAEKLHRFAEQSESRFFIIKTQSDLIRYAALRTNSPNITAGFLGLEGAQVLQGELENLQPLFDAGFRMMAPSHFFDTDVGGSAHGIAKGGLTLLGRKVIAEMEQLGMIVDLAHASPQTIDEVLEMVTKPVLVSHTGVRGTCDNIRNLSDEHLLGIAATGGVIGIGFFPQVTCGTDVQAVAKAIQYTASLIGVEHVALGSDFDGSVETPFDVTGLINLASALLDAGFSDEDVRKIMGENVRRVLLATLPE